MDIVTGNFSGKFTAAAPGLDCVVTDFVGNPHDSATVVTEVPSIGPGSSSLLQATNPLAVPTIGGLSNMRGSAGSEVVIFGANFVDVLSVEFNGVAATRFSVDSSSQITVVVPEGATTGFVSVTTAGGSATSNGEFKVTLGAANYQPIQGLAPSGGDMDGDLPWTLVRYASSEPNAAAIDLYFASKLDGYLA